MAKPQMSAVLEQVIRLAGRPTSEEVTDGQLLERLAAGQQEAAFAALVRRHGSMVFGVCRRMLGNRHDAEEAFQATFLVLFRRARFLRRSGSLASWLYTVAYHASLRAKASHVRRRLRERQVGQMRQGQSNKREVWIELQPILDAELNRLPEKYRKLVVLCYLEGKTNEEAARLEGCPIGTVKGRLARARQMLRTRLARRGLTLSAGSIVALLADQAAAVVPPALSSFTVEAIARGVGKAGATAVSGKVTALADGALKAMLIAKLKTAAMLILALGIAALGAGWGVRAVMADRQDPTVANKSDNPATPAAATTVRDRSQSTHPSEQEGQAIDVSGLVLDANGKPLGGADLAAVVLEYQPFRAREQGPWTSRRILEQLKADDEGRFRILVPATGTVHRRELLILARTAGRALAWKRIDERAGTVKIEFRLPAEEVLRGRLIDLQGHPVAAAQVRFQNAWKQPGPPLLAMRQSPDDLACWISTAATDADGRFTMQGVDPEWRITLGIHHKQFAPQELIVAPEDRPNGSEFMRSLAPARTIEGDVVYEDSGKPVSDARLVIHTHPTEVNLNPYYSAEGQADKDGRFRVSPQVGGFVRVIAYPPSGTPYLALSKGLDWPKSSELRRKVRLALPRGVQVRGILTEKPSGKPVAGARVEFEPFQDDNPYYRRDVELFNADRAFAVTGQDGKFEITTLPGPGHLLINGPTLDYIHTQITNKELTTRSVRPNTRNYPDAVVSLNSKPQTAPYQVSTTLRRGVTVRGRLVGSDDRAPDSAVLLCRSYIPYGYDLNGSQGKEVLNGEFELPGCDPEKRLELFFVDPGHQLGARVELPPDQIGQAPVTVRMQPCGIAKARFLHEDGRPAVKMWPVVQLILAPGVPFGSEEAAPAADVIFMANVDREHHNPPNLITDEQGRTTFVTLIPGAKYWTIGDDFRGHFRREFSVGTGQTIDLGDIAVASRR